jgi:hypothetical protein
MDKLSFPLSLKETISVIPDLKLRMGDALRLTAAGRLLEATALLQGLPPHAKETLNNACESEDLAAEGMISPVSAPLLRIAGSVSGIG